MTSTRTWLSRHTPTTARGKRSASASHGGTPTPRGGQALVEFALLAPVLLLLMLLAVDFGRLFFSYVAVNNAAREGAAYAGMHAADSSYDQTTYEAGVIAAALQEANVQGQGGEGSATVDGPECFGATSGIVVDCHVASDFAGGHGHQVRVEATPSSHS